MRKYAYKCRDCGGTYGRGKIFVNGVDPALPWQGVYLVCMDCSSSHLLAYAAEKGIPEEEWEKRVFAPWNAA
eukprot:4084913-Alexandrium_andersonii.AAC.1